MKLTIIASIFLLFFFNTFAQVRLISKVGTYDRTHGEPKEYEKDFPLCFKEFLSSSEIFQGYDENAAYPGLGEISYYFKGSSCPTTGKVNLTKPIIVLDGFDPLDTRSGAELYGKYLSYGNKIFLGDKLRNTNTNEIGGIDGNDVVILNFPQYARITGGISFTGTFICPFPNLPPSFCSVFGFPRQISYPAQREEIDGGADYMERNAMVLIELIRNTNATLKANGSNEKIVIIGPSMGGLISRYALAYMEKRLAENPNDLAWKAQWDHNCKLWVSLDSPHAGANISIGAQGFLNFFGGNGNVSAQTNLEKKIRSPAAKQLLLHHELAGTPIASGAPGFRDRFATAITALGFPNPTNDPLKLRKIAITNGSINGTKIVANDCQSVLTMLSTATLRVFRSKVFSKGKLADAEIKFSGNYGNACEVFKGSQLGSSSKSVLASSPSNNFSYDNSPGGTFNTLQTLSDEGSSNYDPITYKNTSLDNGKFLGLGSTTHFNINQGSHAFIPTKSSLAFKGTNPDFSEDLSGRSLVCTGETPFDSYYSPLTNESHVFLTQKSVDYVLSEIRGMPQKPLVKSSSITSTGKISCTDPSSRITFSIPAQPTGSVYNWSIGSTGQIAIESGAGTNSIVVKKAGTLYSTETVSLSVTTPCSQIQFSPITFNVAGIFTSSDYPISGPDIAFCNGTAYFHTVDLPGATNYMWYVSGSTPTITGQGTASISFTVPNGITTLLVGLRVASACDPGGAPAYKNTSVTCGIAPVSNFTISPNPANQQILIESNSLSPSTQSTTLASEKATTSKVFEVQLFNKFQQVMRVGKSEDGKIILDTKDLLIDFYYLKINDGMETTTHQVLIQR